jgi:electron transfer flavoprotein alpha subunit
MAQMAQQNILVLAEHDNEILKKSTATTLAAARLLPGEITVLVIGAHCEEVAEKASQLEGVARVWLADSPVYHGGLAENIAELIAAVGKEFAYILAAATTYGKNILPRAAALLDMGQISEIIRIIAPDTFVRSIYAGNALATVQSLDPIKLLTVRPTAFEAVRITTHKAPIERLSQVVDLKLSQFISRQATVSERPELTSARVVVAGGRGLQSGENFRRLLEEVADKLGGALGASRAAVDAGFVPNDYQVGQTGKVVAPDLYIAVGISGAIQHLAGMKDSKVIVAINKDPDAPIFQVADYGLVGDLFTLVPELSQELAIRMEKSQVE